MIRTLPLPLAAAGLLHLAFAPSTPPPTSDGVDAVSALQAPTLDAYARVDAPRPFSFPRDHGPHPDHQTEWWYFTGSLEDPDANLFGFQFTIFRTALQPELPDLDSPWAARDLFMAHFTVTDVAGAEFHVAERLTRGALDLAHAHAEPFQVAVESWSVAQVTSSLFPWTLRADHDDVSLQLQLRPEKPLVLQGDRGFSPKGPEPGNASHYLSFTRLAADGQLTLPDRDVPVSGSVWMDHEWSTSVLGDDLAGWDWVSLQLDDDHELMVYGLRQHDGQFTPASEGTWVDPSGATTRLAHDAFSLTPTDRWTSPDTGVTYPSGWRLRVPSLDLDLEVEPLLRDQELDVLTRYWEGAVRATGTRAGRTTRARGYVELVGYTASPQTETTSWWWVWFVASGVCALGGTSRRR